jgi:hypothetical protein
MNDVKYPTHLPVYTLFIYNDYLFPDTQLGGSKEFFDNGPWNSKAEESHR